MLLMRMISCSMRARCLQRTGMLLRCVHLLRHIVAACPAFLMVGMSALRVLQFPSRSPVQCCCHMHLWQALSNHWRACSPASCKPVSVLTALFWARTKEPAGAWLLWSPAQLARLPPAAKQLPLHTLLRVLTEGVTLWTDFLAYNWRPRQLLPDAIYVPLFPSASIGTLRSALYQDQVTTVLGVSRQPWYVTCRCTLYHLRGWRSLVWAGSSRLRVFPLGHRVIKWHPHDRCVSGRDGRATTRKWKPCWAWALQAWRRARSALLLAFQA